MKFLILLCLAYVASASNPCTEEVLRSPEIMAFADPMDRTQYVVCTEVGVFVRMPCATGTVFNEEIRHCVPDGWVKPICPLGTCLNNADCIIDEVRNEYKCLCPIGFTGLRCEVNIDECALEGNRQCSSQGGKCVDQINAYYCDFGATVGLERETAIPRPCTLEDLSMERQFFEIPSPTMNVFLQCTSENRWTVSRCADMLFWDQELRTCSIERPVQKTGVCKTFPCRNDGVCEDLGDFQFRCECKEGFTGPMCEVEIDFCLESPCGAGRCVSHKGGYNCVCQNNVVDSSCSAVVENPCTATGEYWTYSLSASRYFSCGLGGFAFVRDCPVGEFWQQSVLTCMAPEVVAPQRRIPMMSLFDRAPMSSNTAYGGYSQEVPQFVPRQPVETTTLAPAYGGYRQEVPQFVPRLPVETTTLAPAYGGYRQEVPQFVPRLPVETTTLAPAYGGYRQEVPMLLEPTTTLAPTTTVAPAYGGYRQEVPQFVPRLPVETTTLAPAYGGYKQEVPMLLEPTTTLAPTTTVAPAYGGYSQEVPQFVPRLPVETTTMAPRYSRPQLPPKMTPTPATPAYGQQLPQMRLPVVPQRPLPRLPTNHY